MGSSKGSAWERKFAKDLSLWWSNGQSDDWFWRVLGSGGRATNRAKQGLKTAGGYGDICATDARGQELLDLCCFELKRGYNFVSVQDLLDKTGRNTFRDFLDQTTRAASLAGAKYWFLVHKRDRREALVWSNIPMIGPERSIRFYENYQWVYGSALDTFFTNSMRAWLKERVDDYRQKRVSQNA